MRNQPLEYRRCQTPRRDFFKTYIRGEEIAGLAECRKFRIRQVGLDAITMEICWRLTLLPGEIEGLTAFLRANEFKIEVIARSAIDWGDSAKGLSFRREV